MSTTESRATDLETPDPQPLSRVPVAGRLTPIAVTVAIFIVSVVSWWLIGDSKWSVVGARASDPTSYAEKSAIVSCLLFWTIFGHIFTGFTFETWPFNKLSQPLAGVVQICVDLLIGVLGTLLFTRGLGSWDPTFSADTAGGAGYTASAFIVLIGFYAYAFPAASLGGYPFDAIEGPAGLVARWLLGAVLTALGVIALVYPNFSPALAGRAPLSLADATGWIYSSIVFVILSAQVWVNALWARIVNPHLRALAALVVTLGGGAILMVLLETLLHALVPSFVANAPGYDYSLEAAELGVCIALTALIAGLIFVRGDEPLPLIPTLVRTAVVLISGVLVYVVFMRFAAVEVLHFPAVRGSYGGNPLLWMDWAVLVVLWHAVAFGGWFGTRARRGSARRAAA